MDSKKVKKIASKEVRAHEKRLHKMAKGGVTSLAMKTMGRNMARAANQRSK